MAKIGELVRQQRKEQKLKVYELAQKVGISPVYITQIERYNKLPSFVVYKNIENVLKLPTTLRVQFFREKYPEISEEKFPNAFERMAEDESDNSALVLLDDYTKYIYRTPRDFRAFVIGMVNNYNPNKTLNEKEIKQLREIVRKIIKFNVLYKKQKISFLTKAYEISKSSTNKDSVDPLPSSMELNQ